MLRTDLDIRDAFFEEVYKIASMDRDFIFISDDMDAFGLRKFRSDFPKQYINIGVAEQNMIDVAAGLAACGKKVFVFGICTYVTMRCFEQIKFSICSMNLPVSIVGVGVGFSFDFDGPTHHGTTDIGIMRMLPEMIIYNPCDAVTASAAAKFAYISKKPVYVRLDKGVWSQIYRPEDNLRNGYKVVKKLTKINIVSSGTIIHQAEKLSEALTKESVDIGIVDILRLKPFDDQLIDELARESKIIFTLEEHSLTGGIGSIVVESLAEKNGGVKILKLAVQDKQFLSYGTREWFLELNGLTFPQSLAKISQYVKTLI